MRAASGFCFCLISIWGATPAMRWGFRWRRWRCGIRGRCKGGQTAADAGWRAGFCCGRATAPCISAFCRSHVDQVRAKYPGIQVIVHPECRWEVCQKADALGSTERLIEMVEEAPPGSMFAIGTEIHLVNRLARRFAPRRAKRLSRSTTRVPVHHDVSHQPAASGVGAGESGRGARGESHQGAADVKQWARVALDRMLEIG